jgi:trans-2,3-dihydro-3-hydroxyanthranilate isomerase
MATLRYLHLDVFTDRALEGNQLAVFPDPRGLTAETMQAIAREMAFSESTFIFAPERGGGARMRIFTPAEELPMAGHPTIGSTFALAAEGRIDPGQREFVFELGIGPTPVGLEWKDGRLDFAWMTQPLPSFGARVTNRAAFAAAVGLEPRDFLAELPIEVVSCGNPFLFAAVGSRGAVDRVSINPPAYETCCRAANVDAHGLFIFTLDRGADAGDETVYSRMLASGLGIGEDPATGSASGPLGAYLLTHGALTPERAALFVSLQGVKMRRPSRIFISIDQRDGRITRVRVGGRSVMVGSGTVSPTAVSRDRDRNPAG